ncbi:hypothetical protein C3489_29030 [Streptomyces sp. Ru71]|nr:hypothetical protein C3489_29030 [Streptomyces sp. Ru71]
MAAEPQTVPAELEVTARTQDGIVMGLRPAPCAPATSATAPVRLAAGSYSSANALRRSCEVGRHLLCDANLRGAGTRLRLSRTGRR